MDSILIFQHNKQNLKLLQDSLRSNFTVIEGVDEASILKDFDICIVDAYFFRILRSLLRLRKLSEAPLYLPVILVVRNHEINGITPEVWGDVDDVVSAPINKWELNARIEVALKARRQSREIERLKESQIVDLRSRLDLAIEAANIGIWDWDVAKNRVSYSREWKLQLGYSEHEISDSPDEWKSRLHPDDLPGVLRQLDNLITLDASRFELEFRLRHEDGSYRWIMSKGSSIMDESRNVARIIGASVDVSDRKRIEEDLRASEEMFRTIFDLSPDGICLNNFHDLSFLDVNRSFCEISGFQKETVLGKTPLNIDLFQNPHDIQKIWMTLTNEGKIKNFETILQTPDGVTLIALVSAVLIDVGGSPCILTISRNITDVKQALEERMKLATAIEQGSEGVVITDTKGNIEYVNPAFMEMSGYPGEELLGQNPRIISSGNHDEEFYSSLWETITNGQVWKGRFINQKKNGSLFHEDSTIYPLRNSEGNIKHFVAVKRDVTETVELSRQLAHSQKMEAIGTLAAGIAHDFNNILFAILGYTELAQGEVVPGSSIAEYLDHVMRSGRRATDMVSQILQFSHRSEAEWGTISIRTIIKEGLKFLRSSIPTTIEISQDIASDTHDIVGDPTQIHQILMNLCVNASHSMKGQTGLISVELKNVDVDAEFTQLHPQLLPGKFVRLTVSDTGHGIPPDAIGHIFEPYFTTKQIGEGTGLGLSVVHGIVKNHGGLITVESSLLQGTSFSIYLPATIDNSADGEESEEISFPRGSGRILVVDDEEALITIIRNRLEGLGYSVTSTTSSTEALNIFKSDPDYFDLVITDLTMPTLTGLDLGKELSRLRPRIPIILVTGYCHLLDAELLARSGISDVQRKPISGSILAKAVAQALRKK